MFAIVHTCNDKIWYNSRKIESHCHIPPEICAVRMSSARFSKEDTEMSSVGPGFGGLVMLGSSLGSSSWCLDVLGT